MWTTINHMRLKITLAHLFIEEIINKSLPQQHVSAWELLKQLLSFS